MAVTTFYGASQTNNSVDNPNNALVQDTSFATLNANTDWLTVGGFASSTGTISKVMLCVSGKRGGAGNAIIEASYELSGVPTGSSAALKFTSPSEKTLYLDVTNDRAWTWSDILNLGVMVSGNNLSPTKPVDINSVAVEVTYGDNSALEVAGRFKGLTVNGTPIAVIKTPSGNGSYDVNIQNLDTNTQYIFIGHGATVTAATGWWLLPGESLRRTSEGGTEFWAVCHNEAQHITVSLHKR